MLAIYRLTHYMTQMGLSENGVYRYTPNDSHE